MQKKKNSPSSRAASAEEAAPPPPPPEEAFEAAMRRAQEGSSGDFKMTEEEVDKFSKAFKDPAFRKMMADYVQDISDPAHRAEQNAYISELEKKGEVPDGKNLIRPQAGFVVKTRKAKDGSKLFVNVVESDQVEKPTSQRGQQGTQWMLPHILGPPRLERDKRGDTVTTFDCCFHPAAVARAKVQKPFRDMVSQTAFETIEKAYAKMAGSSPDDNSLQREYHVLLGADYKTGQPLPLVVGAAAAQEDEQREQKENKESSSLPPEKKKKTRRAGKKKKKNGGDDQKSSSTTSSSAPLDEVEEVDDGEGLDAAMKGKLSELSLEKKQAAPRIPSYTVTERGYFDLADHVERAANLPRRPKELVVAIELPEVKSTKRGVALECSNREIKFTAHNSEDQVIYSLNAGLPYDVDGDAGTAKFDSKTKILSITLPLLPLPTTVKPSDNDKRENVSNLSSDEVERRGPQTPTPNTEAPPEKVPERVVRPPPGKSHSRWLESSDERQASRRPFAKDAIAPREEPPDSPEENPPPAPTADFVAKDRFDGPMLGFAFRSGSLGLGYYRDLIRVEHRQKSESLTLIVSLEGVDKVNMTFEEKNTVKISCTFLSDRTESAFRAVLAGEIDGERCRADASDKNVAVLILKKQPGIWKDPIVLDDRAIDVTTKLPQTPSQKKGNKSRAVKTATPSPTTAAALEEKSDTLTPIAPPTFQNTLLFEIE